MNSILVEIVMEEKTPLSLEVVCFQMLGFGTSKSNSEVSKSNSFLENFVTLEGAVSYNVNVFYYINSSPSLVTR